MAPVLSPGVVGMSVCTVVVMQPVQRSSVVICMPLFLARSIYTFFVAGERVGEGA